MISVAEKIDRQMDKELYWIVTETSSVLFASSKTVKRGDLCKAVGIAVGQVLLDREPEYAEKIDIEEFEGVAWDAIRGMTEETFAGGSDTVARHVAEMCVAYFEVRKMGMRAAYETRPDPMASYNPFGNEGGFCNPLKLKMLHDD